MSSCEAFPKGKRAESDDFRNYFLLRMRRRAALFRPFLTADVKQEHDTKVPLSSFDQSDVRFLVCRANKSLYNRWVFTFLY